MFMAMSHWSDSRPLAYHHHLIFTETPFKYPAVAMSHGDSVLGYSAGSVPSWTPEDHKYGRC